MRQSLWEEKVCSKLTSRRCSKWTLNWKSSWCKENSKIRISGQLCCGFEVVVEERNKLWILFVVRLSKSRASTSSGFRAELIVGSSGTGRRG